MTGRQQNSQGFLGCFKDQENQALSWFAMGDLPVPVPIAICIPPPSTKHTRTHTHTHAKITTPFTKSMADLEQSLILY